MPEPEPNPYVAINNAREQGRQEALRPLKTSKPSRVALERVVSCIGRGGKGEGCGYNGGKSGDTCPECGGMLLSDAAVEQAFQLTEAWLRQDAANNQAEARR